MLVREGFSFGAFLFGPLWLAVHRAWIPAVLALAAIVLIVELRRRPARPIVLLLGEMVLLGLFGHDLRALVAGAARLHAGPCRRRRAARTRRCAGCWTRAPTCEALAGRRG